MFKKLFLVAAWFFFGFVGISLAMCGKMHLAQTQHQHTEESAETEKSVEVGNKICPVSGEEIKEEEAYQVEHQGKIYNLCCKMCAKDFKKDPEKYIKKLEEKEEATHEHSSHEGHHH